MNNKNFIMNYQHLTNQITLGRYVPSWWLSVTLMCLCTCRTLMFSFGLWILVNDSGLTGATQTSRAFEWLLVFDIYLGFTTAIAVLYLLKHCCGTGVTRHMVPWFAVVLFTIISVMLFVWEIIVFSMFEADQVTLTVIMKYHSEFWTFLVMNVAFDLIVVEILLVVLVGWICLRIYAKMKGFTIVL